MDPPCVLFDNEINGLTYYNLSPTYVGYSQSELQYGSRNMKLCLHHKMVLRGGHEQTNYGPFNCA